jgi:hypothetical protein
MGSLDGKTLEFVGKLARAESFERWAESQGEKIISDLALKSGGIIFGLGKESKAKGHPLERPSSDC